MRRVDSPTWFAVAAAAVSAAAWTQTWLSTWPALERLQYPIFQRLFVFTDDWAAALELMSVLIVALCPALRRAALRLVTLLGEHPGRAAGLAFAVLALGSKFAYHGKPFSMDEYAPLAQAYAFAHGQASWTVPVDLLDRVIARGFRGYFFAVDTTTGRVASMYWPGFAALLAPFCRLSVPWLLNPLLGAGTVLLVHSLALKILNSREAGGWAVLFTLASPAFSVECISFYSMPAHLALNLLFARLLLEGNVRAAFAAGLVGGWAMVLHNPLPHLLFAAPWLIWMATSRRRWGALAAVGLGYVPIGIVIGVAWPLFTKSLMHGSEASGQSASLAALVETSLQQMLGLVKWPDFNLALIHLNETWKLWIWSVPGLIILSVSGLVVARGPLLLFAASAVMTYVFYWFVPFDQGHGWGYRYMHSAWGALPLLAAAFMTEMRDGSQREKWLGWAGGLSLTSLVLATSFWFWEVHAVMTEHLAQRIDAPAGGAWMVFVTPKAGLYSWDMVQNLPGDAHQATLMSLGAAADASLMQSKFPGATRALLDSRGSLWRLSRVGP